MPFEIVHNDITNMKTEAIVNAANKHLQMGGGVCGAIFRKAGSYELQKECNEIGKCEVGNAVITKGYDLDSKYIIHAVGPIWSGGNHNEELYLKNAYKNALNLAKKYEIKSISFPLISSGIYGYPKKEALDVAVKTIKEFLLKNDMDVYIVVFDRNAVSISEKLYDSINHFINRYYEEKEIYKRKMSEKLILCENVCSGNFSDSEFDKKDLEDMLNHMDETFSEMLMRLIDEKGKSDVEIYKKANIDRKLFSKIRSNKEYNPKKYTAISLAIALELTLDETNDLLSKAGYSLSNSHKCDVIIKYFIENKNYDIFTINEALFCFEQPLLRA